MNFFIFSATRSRCVAAVRRSGKGRLTAAVGGGVGEVAEAVGYGEESVEGVERGPVVTVG